MKISRNWLQTHFQEALPGAEALSEALTFHAFEIDGVDPHKSMDDYAAGIKDWVLDVKVTPNRGHDCLSHFGIARELSVILKLPLKADLLSVGTLDLSPQAKNVSVSIDTPLCKRYVAAHVVGVTVGPSPVWLKERLEAVGQRSINNIVDATNYVMFDLGQPLHAFAAEKLVQKDGTYAIDVRSAKAGEKLLALDDKEYALDESVLVIADKNKGEAVGIAGVKGGKPAGISESTTEIILESANFDGVSVRKTAQRLKLRTDASQRFEQVLSPELAAYAMQAVVSLVLELSPGARVEGFVDVYPHPQEKTYVSVTTEQVNQALGTGLTGADIADVFQHLGFAYKEEQDVFEVQPPFQRLDIGISEDLIEEVGRIVGYDKVPTVQLLPFPQKPAINQNFAAAEKAREELTALGFSEVLTSAFAEKGERVVLNKVDGVRPYLRTTLVDGLQDALKKNIPNKDLLGLKEVKLFEIGVVWKDGKEQVMLGTITEKEKAAEKPLEPVAAEAYEKLPLSETKRYQAFSKYPYIVRDVAFWTPTGTDEKSVAGVIKTEAGELCVKASLFDMFTKADKTSLAFRLVFQSFEKTLTDEEVNPIMEQVYAKLKGEGFEIR